MAHISEIADAFKGPLQKISSRGVNDIDVPDVCKDPYQYTQRGMEEKRKYASQRKELAQAFADFASDQHFEDSWVAWADNTSRSFPPVWNTAGDFVKGIGLTKMKDFVQLCISWVQTESHAINVPKVGELMGNALKQTLGTSSVTIAEHERALLTVVVANMAMKTANDGRKSELESVIKAVASAYQKQVTHEEGILEKYHLMSSNFNEFLKQNGMTEEEINNLLSKCKHVGRRGEYVDKAQFHALFNLRYLQKKGRFDPLSSSANIILRDILPKAGIKIQADDLFADMSVT